jgi:hypothetical protein
MERLLGEPARFRWRRKASTDVTPSRRVRANGPGYSARKSAINAMRCRSLKPAVVFRWGIWQRASARVARTGPKPGTASKSSATLAVVANAGGRASTSSIRRGRWRVRSSVLLWRFGSRLPGRVSACAARAPQRGRALRRPDRSAQRAFVQIGVFPLLTLQRGSRGRVRSTVGCGSRPCLVLASWRGRPSGRPLRFSLRAVATWVARRSA